MKRLTPRLNEDISLNVDNNNDFRKQYYKTKIGFYLYYAKSHLVACVKVIKPIKTCEKKGEKSPIKNLSPNNINLQHIRLSSCVQSTLMSMKDLKPSQ